MFGSIDKSKGLLFCTHDLSQSLRKTAADMSREVESLDPNRLLNTAPDDLRNYLAAKYRVEPILLLRDQWYADHRETPVDVRYDSNRWIDDKSRPVMVPGERFEVRVPFEGEAELLYAKADRFSMNPPRAVVEKNELVLRYESPADAPRDVRPLVDHTLVEIEQHIGWQRAMIDAHNNGLVQVLIRILQLEILHRPEFIDHETGPFISDRRNDHTVGGFYKSGERQYEIACRISYASGFFILDSDRSVSDRSVIFITDHAAAHFKLRHRGLGK